MVDLTSDDYQAGFERGWDLALAWARVPNEVRTADELHRLLSVAGHERSSSEREQ